MVTRWGQDRFCQLRWDDVPDICDERRREQHHQYAGGGNPTLIHNFASPFLSGPAWSPDGRQIVFTGTVNGSNGIWVMNADGSSVRQLGSGLNIFAGSVSWSPDGGRIVFASYDGTTYQIYVMNADGSNIINITNNDAFTWTLNPAWR